VTYRRINKFNRVHLRLDRITEPLYL